MPEQNTLIKWSKEGCPPMDLNKRASEVNRIINERNNLLEAVDELINADRYEHFAARLNDQEMAAVEKMKSLLKRLKL